MTPSHRLINEAINRWLSKTLAARTALTCTTPPTPSFPRASRGARKDVCKALRLHTPAASVTQ